ncbi:hypothetical protein [Paraburkholderia sp. HD33-4]|uniref:hypothetical protein n=1 Tax=Paraburkholderia sp. HD33-4 TaxID=2883242 RepID=UPI001F2969EC|nr:hypothetical protein [Paraburkholderia sp. HD33-4]
MPRLSVDIHVVMVRRDQGRDEVIAAISGQSFRSRQLAPSIDAGCSESAPSLPRADGSLRWPALATY